MGKAKAAKRNGASASPYDRPSKGKAAAANNIFKFNTSSYGQHILKNPGVADAIVCVPPSFAGGPSPQPPPLTLPLLQPEGLPQAHRLRARSRPRNR